jgi:hypothetical protein
MFRYPNARSRLVSTLWAGELSVHRSLLVYWVIAFGIAVLRPKGAVGEAAPATAAHRYGAPHAAVARLSQRHPAGETFSTPAAVFTASGIDPL